MDELGGKVGQEWVEGRLARSGWRGVIQWISDISPKSKSNMRLATLGGRTAARFYGTLWSRLGGGWNLVEPEVEPAEDDAGVRPPDKSLRVEEIWGGRYRGQNNGSLA